MTAELLPLPGNRTRQCFEFFGTHAPAENGFHGPMCQPAVIPLPFGWTLLVNERFNSLGSLLRIDPQTQRRPVAVGDLGTLPPVQLVDEFRQVVRVDVPVPGDPGRATSGTMLGLPSGVFPSTR